MKKLIAISTLAIAALGFAYAGNLNLSAAKWYYQNPQQLYTITVSVLNSKTGQQVTSTFLNSKNNYQTSLDLNQVLPENMNYSVQVSYSQGSNLTADKSNPTNLFCYSSVLQNTALSQAINVGAPEGGKAGEAPDNFTASPCSTTMH